MFKKILIANRGEIACRVITTARSWAFGRLPSIPMRTRVASMSRWPTKPCASARRRPGQLSARRPDPDCRGDCGAQAIHPGYGFLSENESFAQACGDSGMVFIGPPPFAIHAMGSKSEAKTLMERAKVPLVPGYHGDESGCFVSAPAGRRIGYPVLIKASAGGGGKGMRIVTAPADFAAALESCRREAHVGVRRRPCVDREYVQRPRHIEIQVFADSLGDAVYLFERDCSVQRRHQKVIEEAPAPGMTADSEHAMGEAAVAAARAVGYVGAGTVEFIADPDGELLFHGDEYAAAGRAPGDRDDHRPRSGRMAAACRSR